MRGGTGWRGLLPVVAAGASFLIACASDDPGSARPFVAAIGPSTSTARPTAESASTPTTAAATTATSATTATTTTATTTTATTTTATTTTAPTTTAGTVSEPSTSSTTAVRRPIRLVFTGDVLMHSPLWRRALENGGGVYDFTPMFEHVRPIVESADLAVCHLETPIAPPFEAYTTSPHYGVPAEVVDGLAAAGFDHCSTASNHTFDRGVPGVEATIARFAQVGMTQHGMAATPAAREPVVLDVGGVRIGHVSATYGFDGADPPRHEPWRSSRIDVDQLLADARTARERGAEVVVLSLHWGNSMSHQPTAAQRRIAETLQVSGLVDLVIGHHAHVVQPVEEIGEMWVAWGLGNFVSNMPIADSPFPSDDTRDGLVLEVVLTPMADGSVPVTQVVARPIWVDHDAGWVVRDVATARQDPDLVARIGSELDDSWSRTSRFVPWLLPAPTPS